MLDFFFLKIRIHCLFIMICCSLHIFCAFLLSQVDLNKYFRRGFQHDSLKWFEGCKPSLVAEAIGNLSGLHDGSSSSLRSNLSPFPHSKKKNGLRVFLYYRKGLCWSITSLHPHAFSGC